MSKTLAAAVLAAVGGFIAGAELETRVAANEKRLTALEAWRNAFEPNERTVKKLTAAEADTWIVPRLCGYTGGVEAPNAVPKYALLCLANGRPKLRLLQGWITVRNAFGEVDYSGPFTVTQPLEVYDSEILRSMTIDEAKRLGARQVRATEVGIFANKYAIRDCTATVRVTRLLLEDGTILEFDKGGKRK